VGSRCQRRTVVAVGGNRSANGDRAWGPLSDYGLLESEKLVHSSGEYPPAGQLSEILPVYSMADGPWSCDGRRRGAMISARVMAAGLRLCEDLSLRPGVH
jgi:hypothetical protein